MNLGLRSQVDTIKDCGKNPDPEIDEAIRILKEKYEGACMSGFVIDPIAFALYYTWKYYEDKKKRRRF